MPWMPWVDNISMASGVELRLPSFDHRLVKRAFATPDGVLHREKRRTHIPLCNFVVLSAWMERFDVSA